MSRLSAVLAIVFVLASASGALAELIVYEGFDYPAGGTIGGRTGGTGWDQAWTGGQTVVSGGLDYSGLGVSGNMARANGQGGGAFRAMPSGFNALNGTVWISFLGQGVSEPRWSGISTFNGSRESLFMGSPSYQPSSPHKWGMRPYNTMGDPVLSTDPQLSAINTADKVFFLVRIINGAVTAQLTVWLNPALGGTPDDAGAFFDKTVGRIPFDRIRLGGVDDGVTHYDEIRIGRLYADVIPEPATLLLVGLGGLLARRRRML